MSEIWDKPITDTTDWGGDSSTGGLPVSGRQVQAWLKSRIAKILTEAQITKIIEDWVQENGFADDEGFVTLSSDQEINGLKNFLQGLMVNGGLVKYDPELKVWQLTGNLLVTGGISMYSNLEGFTPSTIMDGILTDEVTITVKDGRLTVLAAESGLNYDELDAYLKKYEYTTISEVDARISELVNGAPQAYDTLKEIADVLQGNVNSIGDILATLAEKANTTYVDEAIADTKTWVEEQQYINEIDPSYIEAALGYQPYDGDTNRKEFTTKTYVKDNFVSRTLANEIEAIHNFLNGFNIAGIPFRKTANGQLFIDASVVFGGGVTMYGTDKTPAPSIFDGLPIDNETIYWDNGVLKAMGGGGGGGVADSVAWANVYGKPTWITNTKPTYNYSEIQGTPDLSVYALASAIPTNNNQLTNGAGYITASALNGYATEAFVNTAVNGAKEWVEEQQYLTEITSGMIESVLGYQPYDGDTNRLGFLTASALNGYATESWVNTALAGYLPLSGGTINGSLSIASGLTVRHSAASIVVRRTQNLAALIKYENSNGVLGQLGLNTNETILFIDASGHYRTLLDSGNYTNYALSKNGGTVNGDLKVSGVATLGSLVRLIETDGSTLYNVIQRNSGGNILLGSDYTRDLYIDFDKVRVRSNGTIFSREVTAPTFRGNLTGKADSASALFTNALTTTSITSGALTYHLVLAANAGSLPYKDNANSVITMNTLYGDNKYSHQLGFTSSGLFHRKFANKDIDDTTQWEQIAYVSSNVASATKLETPRKIWGQSFDGTGDVSGDATVNGNITATKFYGEEISTKLVSNNRRSYLTNTGFSIVGTTTANWASGLSIRDADGNAMTTLIGAYGEANFTPSYIYIGGSRTAPIVKLYVGTKDVTLHGNLLVNGGISMYSQRSLKNILSYEGLSLEQLAVIKPIKFTWKDGRDNRYHVGGVADDMATVVPEVVYSANDFLTMDYGNAGFYVAASLIKPVIYCYNKVEEHEKDIDYLKRENVAIKKENKALRDEINQLKQAS